MELLLCDDSRTWTVVSGITWFRSYQRQTWRWLLFVVVVYGRRQRQKYNPNNCTVRLKGSNQVRSRESELDPIFHMRFAAPSNLFTPRRVDPIVED